MSKNEELICRFALHNDLEVFKYNADGKYYYFTNVVAGVSPRIHKFQNKEEREKFYKKQLAKGLQDDYVNAYRIKFIVDNFSMDKITPVTKDLQKDPNCYSGAIQGSTLTYKEGFPLLVDVTKKSNIFARISEKTEKLSHLFEVNRDGVVIRGKGNNYTSQFIFEHPVQAIWFVLGYVMVYHDWGVRRDNFGTSYIINRENPNALLRQEEIVLYIIESFQSSTKTNSTYNYYG